MPLARRLWIQALLIALVLVGSGWLGVAAVNKVGAEIVVVRGAVEMLERVRELSDVASEYARVRSERMVQRWAERRARVVALAPALLGPASAEPLLRDLALADRAFDEMIAVDRLEQAQPLSDEQRLLLHTAALGQISVVTQRIGTNLQAGLDRTNAAIDGAVRDAALRVGGVIAIGAVLLLLIELRFARQLVRAVRALETAARRIEDGAFEHALPPLRIAELSALAASLAATGARLRQLTGDYRVTIERLEQEIAERRDSEERFQLLSRATNDGIWDWDQARRRLWWNEGLKSMAADLGLQRGDSWETLLESVHPQDRQVVEVGLRAALAGHSESWSHGFRLLRTDGRVIAVEARALVVRSADGQAQRLIGGLTDVSLRRQLEEQLRQAQKLDSLGQLTGGVAHDFNNLLTVIIGNAELLSETLPAGGTEQQLAQMVGTAAQRGAELTQRLLTFARRQALAPCVVDVNGLVGGIEGLLQRTLGEHIAIEWQRDAGLWSALVDPGQLENALLNLAINARDAMPAGGVLTIETANVRLDEAFVAQQPELEAGDYVSVEVTDSGCGIAPDDLARVFEPFFTTKETGKGTGLGLPMVYGFVKQSRGHVMIDSALGRGTTVRLYLPRSPVGQPPAVPVQAVEPTCGGECVLLVEDAPMVREYASKLLRNMGYEVLEAGDGLQALALLRAHADVDLLFTDIVMPGGMSGRELADAAQALRPGLPVLYASGYSENELVHNGRLDAGVLLLRKPYRRADLMQMLRRTLASRSAESRA